MMITIVILAALAAATVVFLRLSHQQKTVVAGWTAVTAGNDYGTTVEPDGSFNLPVGDPIEVAKLPLDKRPGAHYITQPCGSLASRTVIRLHYRIEVDPGVEIHPSSDMAAPSIGPTLYFQREGDSWSGKGEYDGYRWFATFNSPTPIVAGDFVLNAPFDSKWTGVEHFNSVDNEAAFISALAHAGRVGFVFGGGSGYGHGVFATGKARFTLLKLEMI